MSLLLRSLRYLLATGFAFFTAGLIVLVAAYFYIAPQLPPIDRLKDVQLQVPLRIFSADGKLIAEFGEQRRKPIGYAALPQTVIDAILATEDDRFFQHPGVDYQGLLRAAVALIRTGQKRQGGSTITMQVARNFFLSAEKTYLRKLTEIFLALKIEHFLSKQEILELYLNKIYFGQRAYGVGAAAEVYYGLPIDELSLAQIATIAGLPKAPSTNNPVSNPKRALQRRNYILGRMHTLGMIDDEQYQQALKEVDNARLHTATIGVKAPYVAEMVRAYMIEHYSDDAYTAGYHVTTTLNSQRQLAANAAVHKALLAYDRRHGYRGVEGRVDLPVDASDDDYRTALKGHRPVGGLDAALVVEVADQSARVYIAGQGFADIHWDGLSWAKKYISNNHRGSQPKHANDILAPGDLIWVEPVPDTGWILAQVPRVSGALVSLLPENGALQALVGGFDFYNSKFNRATQAERQPGSSFKPFVYSAALAKGYTLASVFNDAPVVFDDPSLETTWRPENYSGKFYGPTRMREALTRSRNLVSIRLLQAIGARYAARYAQRFGFREDQMPNDLSLALGSGSATPMEMARAYSMLANGGFYVEPYFITQIQDSHGEVLMQANPAIACIDCEPLETSDEISVPTNQVAPIYAEQAADYDNMYLINAMMKDVVKRGTGRRAMALGRQDLAGKTGTTNDQRDAWFCGFNAQLVTTVWVGFDWPQPLGNGETGSRAALPMWVDYMGQALKGTPESSLPPPPGLVTVRIDKKTGLRLPSGQAGGLFEIFRPEHVPERYSEPSQDVDTGAPGEGTGEPLF
ncbi:Multimodular transpeptidase-transglycosylase [hydrothermal vent metagenome]|uniref:Penicillin-binding protein 1A n=1 Tax=hydrothermal vent metagenome TaxID=652676 RepID=A0A3B0YUX0_9ZZZZ